MHASVARDLGIGIFLSPHCPPTVLSVGFIFRQACPQSVVEIALSSSQLYSTSVAALVGKGLISTSIPRELWLSGLNHTPLSEMIISTVSCLLRMQHA